MSYEPVSVKVWADWACFTQPELKAERASYPIMTPSAARGILEAIFWKPEFRWCVREIHVLRHPRLNGKAEGVGKTPFTFYRHFSIMRNEVDKRATETPIFIGEARTQRHTLCLRDVAYAIYADVEVKAGVTEDAAKYRDQFRRRVQRGQCFSRPYMGCREFACDFGPLNGTEETQRYHYTEDLGLMLFDVIHGQDSSAPIFFHAQLTDGILRIDPVLYGRYGA